MRRTSWFICSGTLSLTIDRIVELLDQEVKYSMLAQESVRDVHADVVAQTAAGDAPGDPGLGAIVRGAQVGLSGTDARRRFPPASGRRTGSPDPQVGALSILRTGRLPRRVAGRLVEGLSGVVRRVSGLRRRRSCGVLRGVLGSLTRRLCCVRRASGGILRRCRGVVRDVRSAGSRVAR